MTTAILPNLANRTKIITARDGDDNEHLEHAQGSIDKKPKVM